MPPDTPSGADDARQPTRWVAADHVASSPLGDDLALLDQSTGTYFTLNATGARLWGLLNEPATPDQLAAALAETYEVSPDTCRDDVDALLGQLDEHGLVHPVPPA